MATLLFTNYNNYFDRIIKRPATGDAVSGYTPIITMTDILFNPNDGITTTVDLEDFNNVLRDEPNYLVVYTPPRTLVDSRWFIMDMRRLREGQWRCTLRRDVIADNYDMVLGAPCFVEKGWLNYSNPLIFNSEGVNLNQIKYRETLLKDYTNIAWIVGYWSKFDSDSNVQILSGTFTGNTLPNITIDTTISGWTYYNYSQHTFIKDTDCDKSLLAVKIYNTDNITQERSALIYAGISKLEDQNNKYKTTASYSFDTFSFNNYRESIAEAASFLKNSAEFASITNADVASMITSYHMTDSTFEELSKLAGQIIKTSDNKYYKISLNNNFTITASKDVPRTSTVADKLFNWADDYSEFRSSGNPKTNKSLYYGNIDDTSITFTGYRLSIKELTGFASSYTYQTSATPGYLPIETEDAPYDMFCIPYDPYNDEIKVIIARDSYTLPIIARLSSRISLLTAFSLANKNSKRIYDIQLLPYCPFTDGLFVVDEGTGYLDLSKWTGIHDYPEAFNSRYSLVFSGVFDTSNISNVKSMIIHCPNTLFLGQITAETSNIITDSATRKLNIMTEFKRLCSPNYSSVFEFNAQKNNGIRGWEYNCTYKPYTPYIHINPNFGGLYRKDYNDNRGLICAGQFSMPRTEDQFATYELQNKNYQLSFQRTIENIETNQRIDMGQRQIDVNTSIISGGINTIMGLAQQNYAGAASSLINTGLTAYKQYNSLKAQSAANVEALSYAKDQFQYNLDNIKALPQTLTNTSSFDINNKIFPFVESYTCTPEEYEACANKIRYTGMTIGVIGKLSDYLNSGVDDLTFVKGQIIRLSGITGVSIDTHMANEIANEIYKGVYV